MLKALVIVVIVGFIGNNMLASASGKIQASKEKREQILNQLSE